MLETGIKGCLELTVTDAQSAQHIGSGSLKVFATPMMIAMMEKTCRMSVTPYLDEGQETVGTHVDVAHVSSTPVGMKVRCESVLTGIDGRRLTFEVKAYDSAGLIGEGVHERFVIDEEKFLKKAKSKLEKK